jgi:hypothetical protein
MLPCKMCNKPSTAACSACYTTFFCGPECQAQAWPRHKTAGGCAPPIVRALLRDTGSTPLHLCAETSCTESLSLMLRLGIDPNVRNREGKTALMAAALQAKAGSLAALLDGGASISATWVKAFEGERDATFTALTFAIIHCGSAAPDAAQRALACVQLLLARGAVFSAEDAVVSASLSAAGPEIAALVAAARA